MLKRSTIYERNLKQRKEVAASSFYFLFSEIVQFSIRQQTQDLEKQLEDLGLPLGSRFLELIILREKGCKKETTIVNMLMLIRNSLWPLLFNKNNCVVEQHMDQENIYMIKEVEPNMCNLYASLPRGQCHMNCAAFIAGIIEGLLVAANFPAKVSAVFDGGEDGKAEENGEEKRTVYLIKFEDEVLLREARMKRS
jgi:trafficking protein particle complex subunit 5